MLEFLKIAWRNIWRNKRRSIITMSSIFFATFLAIIMRSFQLGSYDAMINTMIEKYTGYIQIENPDFPEEPIIDNTIEYSEEIINKIQSVENVKGVAPRITFFSQAYSDVQNKGIFLMGVDPELEDDMTQFSNQIAHYKLSEEAIQNIQKEGVPEYISEALEDFTDTYYSNSEILSFDLDIEEDDIDVYLPMILKHAAYESKNLSDNDDGVLLGSGLANYLELSVGDSIVLMGLGYHGSSAAAVFPVKGIIVIPNPQLDGRVVYGSLQNIQSYFSAYSYDDDGNQIAQLSTYGINLYETDYKDVEKNA
jgi:ABC-type lipoprotein release transport system permease subunit